MPENINLFTHLRLDDFVKNFQNWYNCPNNPINPNSKFVGNDYDYMSFISSPDAVHLIDIGRIPLTDISNNFKQIQSSNSAGNTSQSNTPLGWKMQLGTIYANMKKIENEKITNGSYKVKPGLYCQIVQLSISDKNNTALTFSDLGISELNYLNYIDSSGSSWIDSFQQNYELNRPSYSVKLHNGTFTAINYQKDVSGIVLISTPGSSSPGSSTSDLDTSFIGMEYFGYFKPESVGNYSFTINSGSDFCLLWLGNKAVCEYITSNADIVSSNSSFKQTFLEDSYMPIRIQYFASKQRLNSNKVNVNERQFSLIVKNTDTNQNIDNLKCFTTIMNPDGSIYFPKFIYCAFTSSTISDFQQGSFKCYSFGGEDKDYASFFSYMKNNKKKIFSGLNDSVIVDGMPVSEYGTLPNGINYTDAYNASTILPSKLSIYRIYSDIRMGRSFQVDKTSGSSGKYVMTEVSNNILKLTNKYTEFPNYYPSNDIVNGLPAVPIKSGNDCMNKCNSDISNCSYYYTFGSSGEQFCVTGTKYSSPVFNQIPGPNQKNGSLFIRGNQTVQPTLRECIIKDLSLNNMSTYSSVKNTIDYTASNPYYNYTISGDIISNLTQIGDCTNPSFTKAVTDYQSLQNEAKSILYNKTNYQSDGEYYASESGPFSFPNYSNISATCSYVPGVEPFQSKLTDGTNDTSENINKLYSIQQIIKQKEDLINANKEKISNTLIPNFIQTRNDLKNDNKYDYNGDILLYLRDTKIPSKDEQRLIDSSDERFKQVSMYSLGIITAATLIILAIYTGRD
jgi:hypothetical protein